MNARDEVLAAASNLVSAFGAHDPERYFSSFAPDATFLFYSAPALLPSRDAYRDTWRQWEAEGFRVLGCDSREGEVRLVTEDVAVFTHVVTTRQRDENGERVVHERETIVFRREAEGRWLGVHEHLSPAP